MNRWSVKKVNGRWRVFDGGLWHDSFRTLPEAHTFATQQAVADELFEPGGLTYLSTLKKSFVALHHIRSSEMVSSL